MKFFNEISNCESKEELNAKRLSMIDEAEAYLDEGDIEAYNARVEDVNVFDNECREYAENKANIEAMKGAQKMENVLNTTIESINTTNNDVEYRKAFMNYVLRGQEVPAEFKNTAYQTTTSDIGAVIPNTIIDKIYEKMEAVGNILNKVTRTAYKGGVTVPTSAAKPTATWVAERGGADSQKKAVTSITFAYHKLKVVIAVSLAADTVSLEVFERTLVNNITEAMVKALETAIISGTGADNNQPEGIIKTTAIEGQTVEIAEGDSLTFAKLCEAEGKLPEAYEGAVWLMSKKTYFGQVVAMTDSDGQPIARTSVGLDGKPAYNILGRPVIFTSAIADFATSVEADTVVACLFRLEDYLLNTNMDITIKQYVDEATDDQMTKALMLADGKVCDKNSFVPVVIKNA